MKTFKTQEGLSKLIGKEVTAIGCCGMGEGKKVTGILETIQPYAVVNVPNPCNKEFPKQPYMVINQTIEAVKSK